MTLEKALTEHSDNVRVNKMFRQQNETSLQEDALESIITQLLVKISTFEKTHDITRKNTRYNKKKHTI